MNRLFASALLIFALVAPALADETSHRAEATKVVEIVGGEKQMHASLNTMLTPMLERMRQQNISQPIIDEAKDVVTKWFEREVKWDDLKPQIVAIYMKAYSEAELKQLIAFLESEIGKKFVSQTPTVMQGTAQVVQTYFASKQSSLQFALGPVIEKAKAAAAAPAK